MFLISWRHGCLLEMGGSWNPFLEPIQSVSWVLHCLWTFKSHRDVVSWVLSTSGLICQHIWYLPICKLHLDLITFRHLENLIRSFWQLTWNLAILSFRVVRTPISPGVALDLKGWRATIYCLESFPIVPPSTSGFICQTHLIFGSLHLDFIAFWKLQNLIRSSWQVTENLAIWFKKDLHIMFLSNLRDAPLSAEWNPKPYLESNWGCQVSPFVETFLFFQMNCCNQFGDGLLLVSFHAVSKSDFLH